MALVAVASVLLAFLAESQVGLLRPRTLFIIDGILILVQLADWMLGLYHTSERRRYVAFTAWELPGLVPLAVSGAGALRLLRLLRLVRVARALLRSHALITDGDQTRPGLQVTFLSWATAGVTGLAALLVWIVESPDNPDLQTFPDALWWAIVTVTQVGYGDIVPRTSLGKSVAVMLMVAGIAAFVILLSVISLAIGRRRGTRSDIPGELERLARLRDEGSLDDEEFKAAKERLLRR